jgi:ammonium transporter, Amt family
MSEVSIALRPKHLHTDAIQEYIPPNPREMDVNENFAGVEYNAVYIGMCAYLVFMIIPGLALFYGGLARRRSALSMLFLGLTVTAVT